MWAYLKVYMTNGRVDWTSRPSLRNGDTEDSPNDSPPLDWISMCHSHRPRHSSHNLQAVNSHRQPSSHCFWFLVESWKHSMLGCYCCDVVVDPHTVHVVWTWQVQPGNSLRDALWSGHGDEGEEQLVADLEPIFKHEIFPAISNEVHPVLQGVWFDAEVHKRHTATRSLQGNRSLEIVSMLLDKRCWKLLKLTNRDTMWDLRGKGYADYEFMTYVIGLSW